MAEILDACCGGRMWWWDKAHPLAVYMDKRIDVLCLRWTCEACGWPVDINAPGFAGDGRLHYPDGRTPCGPIRAQRADAPQIVRDATPTHVSSPTRVLIGGVPIEDTPDEPGTASSPA